MIPDTPVPPQVRALAGDTTIRPVWENELGGLTFELGTGAERRFVKWTPASSGIDLDGERVRLDWAAGYTAVPVPLDYGEDADSSWLVTAALPGQCAVAPRWLADPETAVEQIGVSLRALHERLPVPDCPFTASAEERLAEIRGRTDRLDPTTWNEDHQGLTVDEALSRLSDIPPVDLLVVCHGDTCAPNTLLTDDGRWSGHVDLGGSVSPTDGRTWRSPPGARSGTTAMAGRSGSLRHTASSPSRSAPSTTACCGVLVPSE